VGEFALVRRHAVVPSPIFGVLVAVAVFGAWLAWTGHDQLPQRVGVFLFVVAGWLVTLCLHEFAHAYLAYRGGDRSVESAGYLTLNPLKYAHPLLSLALPLFFILQGGIGLPGGAVFLHQHAMRSRAARSMSAAAGPAVNAAFAIVLLWIASQQGLDSPHRVFWAGVAFLGFLQVTAAVLNLLPIPGLDGYATIEPFLAPRTARSLEAVKPFGLLAVLVLLQVDQINVRFFDLVDRLYDASGASEFLWRNGYLLFRFWAQLT
jgi:Zn-dependent protease